MEWKMLPTMTTQALRGRYAPSPSGDLHLGNLRTALLAWLFARAGEGQFVLRIEDLDAPRVRADTAQRMLDDLRWLGMNWDEGPDCGGPYAPYVQSERRAIYSDYLQRLRAADLVYPCYCSRAEVAQAARIASVPQQGAEEGPRYPGTCRTLTKQQRAAYEAAGRRPALRFRVDEKRVVTFHDLVEGTVTQHVQSAVGDFIICRSDDIFAYQFAVVVDDGLMHINQVVRGSDLLSSTARQILLFEALGFPLPTFAHVPLLLDEQGKRLAKRTQSAGIAPLRAAGASPEQIVGQLAASCGLLAPGIATSPYVLVRQFTQPIYDIMRAISKNNITILES
jgi:glutamyl-tRNA synthetase